MTEARKPGERIPEDVKLEVMADLKASKRSRIRGAQSWKIA
ncbi:MAG TPA: hypothetical protein VMV23_05140 [Candidatus Nanopelagicaceae bacterium]|nr:hypothetical protein [Candidatus Nanopelagicaceae bacterium]HVA07657.1 hypothetical protein [Acidimicrobiales bacterium]